MYEEIPVSAPQSRMSWKTAAELHLVKNDDGVHGRDTNDCRVLELSIILRQILPLYGLTKKC